VKRILILSILVFVITFSVSAEGKPTIAIMDVAATNTSDVKSQVIYEYIVDVVNRANRFTIVERSALQAALKEMEISSSGMVDDSTAAAIGKLAGAKLILISNLIVDDGITYLSARIVAVETGQVSDTAMLQKEGDEYIASLANRTISQLLGEPAVKPETVEKAAVEVAPEKGKEESAKTEVKQDSDSSDSVVDKRDSSGVSLVLGGIGILPIQEEGEDVFIIGYGFKVDLDFNILKMGTNNLTFGVGSGVFYEATTQEDAVAFPFNMISFPLAVNIKYKIVMNGLFINAKIGGGGTYNVFTYADAVPPGIESTLFSLNPAIFPGLTVGYMLSDSFGLALFADFSMTFFSARPYRAVNAGLAAAINL